MQCCSDVLAIPVLKVPAEVIDVVVDRRTDDGNGSNSRAWDVGLIFVGR